jgi:MoaA/NifB/PqqE/SkfB family radical SAM enzyme
MDQITPVLDPAKFRDPFATAKGETRATVALRSLDTLWFNTGTLCNLTCANCYIESSPRNDRLDWLSVDDVRGYLDEIARDHLPTRLIGFTGGEPFMNREIIATLELVLSRGLHALVLTNAMLPLRKLRAPLLDLLARYGERLTLRVSLDHYTQAIHEAERGRRSWAPTIDGLVWLAKHGFALDVAGRHFTTETDARLRAGYARLFAELGVALDAYDPVRLMLFPEMDPGRDVPEITTSCWGILHKSPDDVMCASARMVVKRKDAAAPAVLACTLIPYDPRFELGRTLKEASGAVPLNHPYCASFCVLGGAACSR